MSPLATEIYRCLYRRVPAADGRINYAQLVALLDPIHDIRTDNDHRLNDAYAEIVHACRAMGSAPLTAILVALADGRLTIPSTGYFRAAHPGLPEAEQIAAWGVDYELARQTAYPEPEALD